MPDHFKLVLYDLRNALKIFITWSLREILNIRTGLVYFLPWLIPLWLAVKLLRAFLGKGTSVFTWKYFIP
jgi:hypothetical protein